MRLSQLFPRTLHQAPAEAVQASHRLLLRAGYLRSLGEGTFALLPLGQRVRRRIADLAAEALGALGGQEASWPPLVPADAWVEAGLSPQRNPLGRYLRDGADRLTLLPHTLEPLLTAVLQADLRSHRLLPLLLYNLRSRFQEERAVGGGPLSPRQSLVLEAFSVQPDGDALERARQELVEAWAGLLARFGLDPLVIETVVGPLAFAGQALVDLRVPGSDALAHCPACAYAADLSMARRAKLPPPPEEPLPLEEVYTPDCHTIADLAEFLDIPKRRTAKAVFLISEDRFFFVIVRGDMDVSEEKLARLVGARELRPALEHEVAALGASPGYASPIGIRRQAPDVGLREVLIVVDELIPQSPNLVAGANKEDTHLRNVNYGRDYSADLVGDLVTVRSGDPCPDCQAALEVRQSTVLARVWTPGAHFSQALGATFQDGEGREWPLQLACADLSLDALMAACVEVHHDDHGVRWPATVAPYTLYLLTLGSAPEVVEAATALYGRLQAAGIAVLFDDRDERAGVKFTDADLIGLPLRVAVSRRTLVQEGAEVKRRDQPREAVRVICLDEVAGWAQREAAACSAAQEG